MKKLLDSAKNLVISFQLKCAKSSEILPKQLLFLRWLKSTNVSTKPAIFLLMRYCHVTKDVQITNVSNLKIHW